MYSVEDENCLVLEAGWTVVDQYFFCDLLDILLPYVTGNETSPELIVGFNFYVC